MLGNLTVSVHLSSYFTIVVALVHNPDNCNHLNHLQKSSTL
jgi:hypothetical protein